jgi:hypothetical protein
MRKSLGLWWRGNLFISFLRKNRLGET